VELGSEDLKAGLQEEFLMLHHGLAAKTCNRGQLGVAIVLDTDAQHAFEQAGSWKKAYGNRILAAHLRTKDAKGKPLQLFVVMGYTPTFQHTQEEREEFQQSLDDCMADIGKDEIPVMGLDANAQLGTAASGTAGRLGEGGRKGGVLQEEDELWSGVFGHLLISLLCAPFTWFGHKNYQTWTNPRWKTKHTLDHWLVRRADLKRGVNARIHASMSLHSDHRPIMLELRIPANLGKRNGSAAPDRPQAYFLTDPETRSQFRRTFLDAFERSSDADEKEAHLATQAPHPHKRTHTQAPHPHNDTHTHTDASTSTPPQAPTDTTLTLNPIFEKAKAALAIAALTLVAAEQPVHAWFTRATAHLMPLIEKRQSKEVAWNSAEAGPDKKAAARKYSKARRDVQKEVKRAKDRHLLEHFEGLRQGAHPGQYWEIVNKLRGGLGKEKKGYAGRVQNTSLAHLTARPPQRGWGVMR